MATETGWIGLVEAVLRDRRRISFPLFGRSTVGPSWTTQRRRLPLHLLYYVVDKTMAGDVAGEAVTLPAGTLLWMPPDCEHHLLLPRGAGSLTVLFLRIDLGGLRAPVTPLRLADAWDVAPAVEHLLDELRSTDALGDSMQRSLLVQVLIRALRRAAAPSAATGLTAAQRLAVIRHVEQRLHERPTPAGLARLLDLSPDYFSRLFRQTFGRSPRAWLVQERLRHAATRLAETTEPIKRIAYSLGYDDLYLFSRQFKRTNGQSPRAFRRSQT